MNKLLELQLRDATLPDGQVDLARLVASVEQVYEQHAEERRGVVRAMQLMSEEARVLASDAQAVKATESDSALRESEARYRTLVEHAPEVIVVLDVDKKCLVDVNDNAVRFFKRSRAELLALAPDALSAEAQPDGYVATLAQRDYLRRALAGESPVYEWNFRDSEGGIIPCEVRLVRLPSSDRLIRGSITDITERKRGELLAAGERRVFERLAANVDLPSTLPTIVEMAEKVCNGALCAIRLADERRTRLQQIVAPSLPPRYAEATTQIEAGLQNGSCAAALFFSRQIIVTNIADDPFWESLRSVALEEALRASWSTLIYASSGKVLGTVALYFKATRSPMRHDFDLMSRLAQLAGIAIERRRAEDALRESEQRYRRLFDNVMEGVYMSSIDGRFLSVNPALVKMVGAESAAELLSLPPEHIYVDPLARLEIIGSISRSDEVRNAEFQLRRLDGTHITVVENARGVRDKSGRLVGFEGTISDISARKRAELAVLAEKDKAQITLQSIGDAVITTDAAGVVEYVNPVAEELTGWHSNEICGHHISEAFNIVNEQSRDAAENPVMLCLRTRRVVEGGGSAILINRRGQEVAIEDSAAPIRDRSGNIIGVVMVFHDVSKERRLRRALAYQAHHDALTGLINRREFENRLTAALNKALEDEDVRHVLMYLDLDQFKVINDTCGHQAGDQLLKQVTGVLQTRLRSKDVIARLGGDEFGVLLENCNEQQAMPIAEAIRQAIRDFRFMWNSNALNVGVSIGFVEINSSSGSIVNLMSAADVACYAAKDSGRNRVHAYQRDEIPQRHREMQWVSRIARACEEKRLELYFQPIVPIGQTQDAHAHFELLLRMRSEDGELVLPGEFIPAAERYNLMSMLDRWVIQQVLSTLVHGRHRAENDIPYTVSVNLSGTSLNDDGFLDFIISELQQHELSPRSLCFEITETAAIANLAKVNHFMHELKSRGCLFSLDDFGSGLSSFMYLKNLPVDFLKIDGQFIQNVNADNIDRSMVMAITQIGHAMGIRTIAERVESVHVLQTLGAIGVEYAQGFLIAEPKSIQSLSVLSRATQSDALLRSA
jgi:diguanylate cyclase (GGDEF)-like protein/PAS domain S-box-containing protein